MSSGPTRYYLYIPVWATGTPPQGGGSSGMSSGSGGSVTESSESSSSVSSSMPPTESTLEPSVPTDSIPSQPTESSSASGSGGSGTPSASMSSQFTESTAASSGASSSGDPGSSMASSGISSGGGSSGGGSSGGGTGSGGTGPGGTGPGGTGPGGTGPGGTGPGGTGPGGTGPGSSGGNCLLFGTLVRLADGRVTPIENLKPGDLVASIRVPGLEVDVPYRAQYNWLSHHGLDDADRVPARVASITLGEHQGFVVINRRIKATPEHPILIRRGDEWGFASAEFVQPGDRLVDEQFNEEPVERVDRVEAPTRTVAIHIPGTNTLLAEGVWVHNDLPATAASSGSGSGISASASGSESGSSSGSGSSGKTSGSSSFSSSGSSSGSESQSESGSGPGFSATGPQTGNTMSGIVTFGTGPGQSVKE